MRRFIAGLALVAALALVFAACGSDDSGGGSDNASTGANTAKKPTGAPIKIGLITDTTRPDGINQPWISGGAQVHVDAVNAAGGINGRPLELLVCDTKGDPNTGAACARDAVDQGVVAEVGITTIEEAQVFPILEKAGIPVIGPYPVGAVALTSPVSYAFQPGLTGVFLAAPALLAQNGSKKPSMMYPSNIPTISAGLAAFFKAGVKQAGVQLGPIAGYELGATQYTAQAVKATSDGADGVMAFGAGESQGPVLAAVRQQSPDIPAVVLASSLTPGTVKYLGDKLNGTLVVSATKAVTSDAPGIKQFNDEMEKYGKDYPRIEVTLNSWAAAWAAERLAADIDGTVDAAAMTKAVSNLTDFDMGGIFPPITTTKKATTFPGMDRVFNASVDFQKIEDGKYVSTLGDDFFNPFPDAPDAG